MATTASGIIIPGDDPTTTPVTPLEAVFNNLGKSLNGRIIVPVPNAAAAAQLLVDLAAEGYTPSAADPVYIDRSDTGTLERNAGNGWQVVYGAERERRGTTTFAANTIASGSFTNNGGVVTFDKAFPATPSWITAKIRNLNNGTFTLVERWAAASPTGVTFYLVNVGPTSTSFAATSVDWTAAV